MEDFRSVYWMMIINQGKSSGIFGVSITQDILQTIKEGMDDDGGIGIKVVYL